MQLQEPVRYAESQDHVLGVDNGGSVEGHFGIGDIDIVAHDAGEAHLEAEIDVDLLAVAEVEGIAEAGDDAEHDGGNVVRCIRVREDGVARFGGEVDRDIGAEVEEQARGGLESEQHGDFEIPLVDFHFTVHEEGEFAKQFVVVAATVAAVIKFFFFCVVKGIVDAGTKSVHGEAHAGLDAAGAVAEEEFGLDAEHFVRLVQEAETEGYAHAAELVQVLDVDFTAHVFVADVEAEALYDVRGGNLVVDVPDHVVVARDACAHVEAGFCEGG